MSARRAMACVFVGDDDVPFLVAETPHEVAGLVVKAMGDQAALVELTLANRSGWNNKPLIINPHYFRAASPPRGHDEDDDA